MGKKKSIVGMTLKMKNGQCAKCIEYFQWDNITVCFEDGTIARHKTKAAFLRGEIKNNNIPNTMVLKSSCEGEVRTMKNGLSAKCISYRTCKDIDVMFEDGTIVTNKSKREFYQGTVANPTIGHRFTSRRPITGNSKVMNCGLKATVIYDNNAQDIGVEFEDGIIVNKRCRGDFYKGTIDHPYYSQRSLPQQLIVYCVSKYFPDTTADYRPNFLKNDNSGRNFEIDVWIPSKRIGIEYDGYPWHSKKTKLSDKKYLTIEKCDEIDKLYSIVEEGCVCYESYKRVNFFVPKSDTESAESTKHFFSELKKTIGIILKQIGIECPDFDLSDDQIEKARIAATKRYVGLKKKMKNGLIAEIIAFRGQGDIDVLFEDGLVVRNRRLSAFRTGEIKNHNHQPWNCEGIRLKMRNGLFATCIAYRKSQDIDLKFDDGVIVYHKSKTNFFNGRIAHPDIDPYVVLRKKK